MKVSVFGLPLGAALLVSGVVASQQDDRIYYGSRAGMHLTTVSKEGIGSASAVIKLKHTPQDAKAFCVQYAQDNSMACVNQTLATVKAGDRVTGNCVKKTWTDMYDRGYAFLGKATKPNQLRAEYLVKDLSTGEILDGSSASGFDVQLTIFKQLCPGLAR